MIDVVVGGEEIVDLLHAGGVNDFHDAIDVPGAGAAGVGEHRLPARCDPEIVFPALDVHHVNLERFGGGPGRAATPAASAATEASAESVSFMLGTP